MHCEYSTDTEKGKACRAYFELDPHCSGKPEECPLREARKRLENMGRLDLIMDTPSLGRNAEIEGGL